MSDCRRTLDRLAPYVDAALTPQEQQEVQQHLDACPPCRVSAVKEEACRALLRARAETLRTPPMPPGLRTRCAAIASEHAKVRAAAPWRTRFIPAALTAALVLFTAFAVFSLATQRSNTLLAAQLSADHDRCFRRVGTPAGSLDAQAEEARLADDYGWDVHIPPSSAADGVRLVGARRCLFTHGGVPHLLYEVGGQELSLYVFEGMARPGGDLTAFGHRAHIWTRGSTTFVLVSPDSAGDLARAISYVQQEAH